jgi:hypothetical protein
MFFKVGFGKRANLDYGFEYSMMNQQTNQENRGKQVAIGGLIIFSLMFTVIGFLLFWRYIPGWFGESVGKIAGLISTPFILEASFLIMGLGIVIMLNSWRRKKAGDDFVDFDAHEFQVEDKDR